jgi:5-methylcytosine-specific restriction endonuclease McrA
MGGIVLKSLRNFSNNDLLNSLNKLVKQEHNLTCEILLHIIEVENRGIHRELGYSSLFVYCTDGLGYSEASAQRRICAARAIRKCPDAYDHLRDGRVNLSTLAIAWKHISPELLETISGKSQKQVFEIVSGIEPKLRHPDQTRPVIVEQPAQQPAGACLSGSSGLAPAVPESSPELGENHHRSGGKKLAAVNESTPEVKLETVKAHQVNCVIDDEVMQLVTRCKKLLSGKYPTGMDYNTLILELAKTWLEKHDPAIRAAKREKRISNPRRVKKDAGETSRYISPATRDKVYTRDKGRCTYVGSNGKRCNATWDLEIHHDDMPYAHGGDHSLTNLRLLCAAHNKHEAEYPQYYNARGAAKRPERVFGRGNQHKYKRKRE